MVSFSLFWAEGETIAKKTHFAGITDLYVDLEGIWKTKA